MDNNVRRLGVIVPPGNVAVEREYPIYLPRGIVLNHNRLSRPNSIQTKESILAMNESLELVAKNLAQAYPDVIAYVCTGGSFLEGLGKENEPAERIEQATGIPAVATSLAVVEAIRSFAAKKVYLIAPYPHDVMQTELAFLGYYGFKVLGWDTFNCMTSEENRKLSSEQIAQRAVERRSEIARCDALFISCTNILTMDQIAYLENELKIPVITSNQATLWAALRKMNQPFSSVQAGSLFARGNALQGV